MSWTVEGGLVRRKSGKMGENHVWEVWGKIRNLARCSYVRDVGKRSD